MKTVLLPVPVIVTLPQPVSPRLGFGHLNLLLKLCDRSSET